MTEDERRSVTTEDERERLWNAVHTVDNRVTALLGAVETQAKANTPDAMRSAFVGAMRDAARDPEITRVLYETMSRHARSSLAQYVGERVLTAVTVLVITAVLAWQWVKGGFK